MHVLIAEDDSTSRVILKSLLEKWGHSVQCTSDGSEGWTRFQYETPPQLAILDWMMPGLDGTELCRKIRSQNATLPTYIILLTARTQKEDVVYGLDAGADDYITKPFDKEELRARIRVAERVINLQAALADRVKDLEESIEHIKTLQGIIPICMHCQRIHNDQKSWEKLERYVANNTNAEFSHGVCPECARIHYPTLAPEPSGEVDSTLE